MRVKSFSQGWFKTGDPKRPVKGSSSDKKSTPSEAPAKPRFTAKRPAGAWFALALAAALSFHVERTSAQSLDATVIAEATSLVNNIRQRLDSCGEEGMLGDAGSQRVALATVKPRPMLNWNPKLAAVAQQHANAMVEQNFFDHVDPQGRTVGQRATESGYRWRVVGENLAAGHDTIGDAMRGWLLSTGHCKNLIDDRFTEFGIAKVLSKNPLDPYGAYWVMVVGKPQAQGPQTLPASQVATR